jgi:hypothetical protein
MNCGTKVSKMLASSKSFATIKTMLLPMNDDILNGKSKKSHAFCQKIAEM